MIDRKTIDQVYQATDIVDVVSDFVSLRKAGVNYKGLCPFHDEKTPSFVVSPGRGTCHCFGCGKGGTAINFLMELNNMTYPEAIRWLARKYGIEVIETGFDDKANAERKHREELLALNQWANEWFQQTLEDTPEGQGIGLSYLRSRNFRDDIIRKFQLGYCPASGYGLGDAARKNHISEDNLVETGLCIRANNGKLRDRFFGRVIFPVHNYLGKVVAFGGRILQKKDNVGKYLNSPESPIYYKSNELYGIYFAKQAIQRQDCCYLVEGYTDVISMHQCGIENVVASSGTALTHDQIRLIKKFTTNLTVLYDGDSAGIKASMRGIDMLLEHGLNIKVLLLPDGDDPDSFARKHTAEEYVDYINQHQVDFIRFKTDLLLQDAGNDVRARASVINNIADSIARIDDTITRSLYITECATLTGAREQDIIETVNSTRNRMKLNKLKTENKDTSQASQASQASVASQPSQPSQASETSQSRAAAELMKYVIRYGERTIGDAEDENGNTRPLTFVEYVSETMNNDELSFTQPLYTAIIQELLANKDKPNFTALNFLLTHPDDEIRNYALSQATDNGSTIGVNDDSILDHLYETAEKLIADLALAVVSDKITELDHKIKSGTLTPEDIIESTITLSRYKEAQIQLKRRR
ncbi:MAG: DNA primase [Bacteroidaceae bacterium]|nr:DNA primase [Bacteroidaceae bacterium]